MIGVGRLYIGIAETLVQIDVARDKDLKAGFEYDGHVYDSDDKSIQRIMQLLLCRSQTLFTAHCTSRKIILLCNWMRRE